MKLVWRFKIIAFILQLNSTNMKKFFNVFQIPQFVSAVCLFPHSCVSEIRIGIGIRCRASQLPRTGIGRYFFFFFDGCYCYCYWRDLDVIVIVIDGLCKNLCRFHKSFSKNHSQLPKVCYCCCYYFVLTSHGTRLAKFLFCSLFKY